MSRRVQTDPEINSPKNLYSELRQPSGNVSPVKQFRTKNSVANFNKHSSNELMKQKQEEFNSGFMTLA